MVELQRDTFHWETTKPPPIKDWYLLNYGNASDIDLCPQSIHLNIPTNNSVVNCLRRLIRTLAGHQSMIHRVPPTQRRLHWSRVN